MALQFDTATLQAALVGYQQQLEMIQHKMTEIRRNLGKSAGAPSSKGAGATATAVRTSPRKHRMSEEGRARIAAAQRARWAKAKRAAKKAEKSDE
jgi:hypothetical protein